MPIRHPVAVQLWLSRRLLPGAAMYLFLLLPSPGRAQDTRGLQPIAPGAAETTPGSYYALVIGIDNYPAPLPALKTAVDDAKSVAAALHDEYGFQVTSLLDEDATRDKILRVMAQFRKSLGEDDNLLIYYAGHGSFDRETGKGYWLPVDADPDPLDTSHDISADDITTEIRGFAARHVLIVSDSCFSGDLSRAGTAFSPSDGNEAYIRRMLVAPSRTIMASGSDEPVSDSGSGGHSVFALFFLGTLQGGLGSAFTADDLFESIRKSVLTRSGQSPQYDRLRNSLRASAGLDDGDFVFEHTDTPTAARQPEIPTVLKMIPGGEDVRSRGQALIDSGNYPEALSYFSDACEKGFAQACSGLGVLYINGFGIARDAVKAVSLFRGACDAGYSGACRDLGISYAEGTGVDKDPAHAATLFRGACNAGDSFGCVRLGWIYDDGSGVEKDPVQAASLYQKACDAGLPLGCTDLGFDYESGSGVKEDPVRAAALYRNGCGGGNYVGCKNLGWLYQVGTGVAEDIAQAAALYRKACDGGYADGCTSLGALYEDGHGVDKDPTQAATLYRKACDGGESVACSDLGKLYDTAEGVAKDPFQAVTLFRKACDGGDSQGCTNLGWHYENGSGVATDFTQAQMLYRKMCDGGDDHACLGLGRLYESGNGVAKDPAQAAVLYNKACDAGNGFACSDLGRLYENGNGVPKDSDKAQTLLLLACMDGDTEVCKTPQPAKY